DTERAAVLDDIAWPKKAQPEHMTGVAFFNSFRDFTASGFFSSRVGIQDLRYIGNTFVAEWKGCPPEALAKPGVHYEWRLLPAGIACEKPLARNVAEAKRVLELVQQTGVKHGYLENQVFAPQVEWGRAILWARGAALTGPPYLARAAEEHSGPHMPWFWRGDL